MRGAQAWAAAHPRLAPATTTRAAPREEPAPIDFLVIVSPVYGTSPEAEQAVIYYGDLRTSSTATTLPDDVQT